MSLYAFLPGTATADSYPGNEPEKLYNRLDRMAVVYDGTLDRSMPSHSKAVLTGVDGRVLGSSSSVSEEARERLAPIAAALGVDIATEGGRSPLAIRAAIC